MKVGEAFWQHVYSNKHLNNHRATIAIAVSKREVLLTAMAILRA